MRLCLNLDFSSLKDYCFKSVLLMGEEAQDLAIYLIPVVLRIRVESIMVDKNANVRQIELRMEFSLKGTILEQIRQNLLFKIN